MSVPLTINGVTFQYPQEFDKHWGPTLTNWSTAVTNALKPLTGGFLTLSPNPSVGINFANATNTGFLALTVNGSNQLTFNGVPIGATASLTNGHIYVGNVTNNPTDVAMTGDITISNTGVTTLGALKVTDSQISAAASIALSKLASTTAYFWYAANGSGVLTPLSVTASKVVITDSNGLPSTSTVTPATLAFLDATSSVQTQLNNLSAQNFVPTGAMIDFGGTVAPSGWLLCDGSSYATATYPALFSAIGYNWGGSGANFNVPNMTRRVSVGAGGVGTGVLGNAVGNTGGTETQAASITDPGHNHTQNAHQHVTAVGVRANGTAIYTARSGGWGGGETSQGTIANTAAASGNGTEASSFFNTTNTTATNNSSTTGITTNATNIMQPSAVVLKIIKT